MSRFSFFLFLCLGFVISACEGLLTNPDEVAADFTDFISEKNYVNAFFMFSEERRATIDTSDITSIFDFSSQFKEEYFATALMKCTHLLGMMKDSAAFSCRRNELADQPGSYAMVINTYDPELLIKKTIKKMEGELSLIDILRYSRMTEDQKMEILDQKVLEYIQMNPDLPRKDIEMPFAVRHNGVRYVVE